MQQAARPGASLHPARPAGAAKLPATRVGQTQGGRPVTRPCAGLRASWAGRPLEPAGLILACGRSASMRWAGRQPEASGLVPAWARPGRPDCLFFSFSNFCLKNTPRGKLHNFHPRTPFSIILDSLESSQRAQQEYAEKHHSPTRYHKNKWGKVKPFFANRKSRFFCNLSPKEVQPILLERGRQKLPLDKANK